ncbi:hypothetical protein, partial [Bacillus thuringiensis]|uniref:hypothetical protein n=1 Tax=Bacillus thuringiensis TaxID=1428 RepID=UPI002FC331FC
EIQLQRQECSVASRLPARQKAPLCQELHPPHILSEPLPLYMKSSSGSKLFVSKNLPHKKTKSVFYAKEP